MPEVANDKDGDGIDDEVYSLTVDGFKNITEPLIKKASDSDSLVLLIAFGSLADEHKIECFTSSRKAKTTLRKNIKEQVGASGSVSGRVFNLSSIISPSELVERPYVADEKSNLIQHWLTPSDLVKRTREHVSFDGRYKETDIFNSLPGFREDYFESNVVLKRRNKELFNKDEG